MTTDSDVDLVADRATTGIDSGLRLHSSHHHHHHHAIPPMPERLIAVLVLIIIILVVILARRCAPVRRWWRRSFGRAKNGQPREGTHLLVEVRPALAVLC